MTMTTHDVTGWCQRFNNHAGCSGKLLTATGSHWWCACTCHPTPTAADVSPAADPAAVAAALAAWEAARAQAGVR